jgi:DNA repair exonuclease SbcCD ATPase subunit
VEPEAEIDRLYGLPLDEFVHQRDELAKRLRREGEREAADEVKRLRKPSAGAWALNQAVRRRRKETDELLAAGERLRAAPEALLSGGDPAALREAMQEERALASTLADCAEAIASETGKSGPALRERVRATLHAATVDEEAREELAAGRFVREREAVGLGPFALEAPTLSARRPAGRGAKPAARARKRSAPGRGDSATARKGAAAAREEAARQEAAARERQRLAEAERALGDSRSALEEAEARHSAAAADLEAAREELHAAEAAQREARTAANELRREVAKRERELERLRARSG